MTELVASTGRRRGALVAAAGALIMAFGVGCASRAPGELTFTNGMSAVDVLQEATGHWAVLGADEKRVATCERLLKAARQELEARTSDAEVALADALVCERELAVDATSRLGELRQDLGFDPRAMVGREVDWGRGGFWTLVGFRQRAVEDGGIRFDLEFRKESSGLYRSQTITVRGR